MSTSNTRDESTSASLLFLTATSMISGLGARQATDWARSSKRTAIIFTPQLTRISETHGTLIKRYGYAPLERIQELVSQSQELQQNLCVAAHLAHVSFAGATPR